MILVGVLVIVVLFLIQINQFFIVMLEYISSLMVASDIRRCGKEHMTNKLRKFILTRWPQYMARKH